jgi:hypothetical protein
MGAYPGPAKKYVSEVLKFDLFAARVRSWYWDAVTVTALSPQCS